MFSYVLNAIGGDNLAKHLKKSDNPDKSAETYIGYLPSLVGHDEFVVATHYIWQGGIYENIPRNRNLR
jgi:hypothetical protein